MAFPKFIVGDPSHRPLIAVGEPLHLGVHEVERSEGRCDLAVSFTTIDKQIRIIYIM